MYRSTILTVFALIFLAAISAFGQVAPPAPDGPPHINISNGVTPRLIAGRTASALKTLAEDHALLWSSPFRAPSAAVKSFVPLAGITAAALLVDHPISSNFPTSQDQIRYSKDVSMAGTYYSLGAAAAGFITAGSILHDRHAVETGLLAGEAVAHAESISQMLKYAAGRERPDFGEHTGRFWRHQQSF